MPSRVCLRSLEERTSEGLKSTSKLLLASGQRTVQAAHGNVFLTGTLLTLDKTGSAVDGHNQATSNLGIQSTTVTGLLDAKDALDPGDDFVGRGVRGLVEVDDTGAHTVGHI